MLSAQMNVIQSDIKVDPREQQQPEEIDIRQLPGIVATVVTTGVVDELYASHHEKLRVYNIEHGFRRIEYLKVPAVHVQAGRDTAVRYSLNHDCAWLLQIDADAAPFPPDALHQLLQRAFVEYPDADAIGAYCQVKRSYRPTIDTGTGTWEERFPGEGMLPVIRTGGHFLLTKTRAFRRFGPPWFRGRHVAPIVAAFAEVDTFARQRMAGDNPFAALPEWDSLLTDAKRAAGPNQVIVGEDAGFCDALCAAGGRIYVDSNLVVGHVQKQIVGPEDLKRAVNQRELMKRLACGVLE